MADSRENEEAPKRPPSADLTRRELVTLGAFSAIGLAAATGPVVGYLRPGGASDGANVAEIPSEQVGLWDAVPLIVAQRPAAVVRTPGELFAVGSRCPHLACLVKWQKPRRIFFCPCHGARFGPDGSLLGGPSPGPLRHLKVSEGAGRVRVELT